MDDDTPQGATAPLAGALAEMSVEPGEEIPFALLQVSLRDAASLAERGGAAARERRISLLELRDEICGRLLAAGEVGEASRIHHDAGLAWLLLPHRRLENVRGEIAAIEADLLRRHHGAVSVIVTAVPASEADLSDAGRLLDAARLQFRRGTSRPFAGALTDDTAWGPFSDVSVSDALEESGGEEGPRAALCARVSLAVPGPGESLSDRLETLRRVQAAIDAAAGALDEIEAHDEQRIWIGALEDVLAAIPAITDRFADRLLGRALVRFGVGVGSTTASAVESALDESERLAVTDSLEASRVPGSTGIFAATIAGAELRELVAIGDDLVPLVHREPGAMSAILRAAHGIGDQALPLARIDTLRARVHELTRSRFGIGGSDLDRDADENESGERAMRTLIRNFSRMFDSGAARVPLAYAVWKARIQRGSTTDE